VKLPTHLHIRLRMLGVLSARPTHLNVVVLKLILTPFGLSVYATPVETWEACDVIPT
jgi:hypothetical protein